MNDHIDLIIGKDLLYAKKVGVASAIADWSELDLLDVGAIAIIGDDGALITSSGGTALRIQIAVGTAQGTIKTGLIDYRSHLWLNYCAYVAPVLQVSHVGNNGATGTFVYPTTYIAGEEAEITIFQRQDGVGTAVEKQRHTVSTKATDTDALLLARLVDKINAESKYVTAAIVGANVGIALTAKQESEAFEIGIDGVIDASDIIYTTPLTYGKGVGADILASEQKDFDIYSGATSPTWFTQQFFGRDPQAIATETYNQWIITWQAESRSLATIPTKFLTAMLCVPSGATTLNGYLDSLFSALGLQLPTNLQTSSNAIQPPTTGLPTPPA